MKPNGSFNLVIIALVHAHVNRLINYILLITCNCTTCVFAPLEYGKIVLVIIPNIESLAP